MPCSLEICKQCEHYSSGAHSLRVPTFGKDANKMIFKRVEDTWGCKLTSTRAFLMQNALSPPRDCPYTMEHVLIQGKTLPKQENWREHIVRKVKKMMSEKE